MTVSDSMYEANSVWPLNLPRCAGCGMKTAYPFPVSDRTYCHDCWYTKIDPDRLRFRVSRCCSKCRHWEARDLRTHLVAFRDVHRREVLTYVTVRLRDDYRKRSGRMVWPSSAAGR